MYKSLTKTKKYSELEAHETLKRVASANAIIKHYKSSSLITVKRYAMDLSFFYAKANLVRTYNTKEKNYINYILPFWSLICFPITVYGIVQYLWICMKFL